MQIHWEAKIMIRTISRAAAVAVLATACSAPTVVSVEVAEEPSEYYKGRPILREEGERATAYLNFEDRAGGEHRFFLAAKNTSEEPITVDPAAITMTAFASDTLLETRRAIDPEKKLRALERRQAELDDSHAASTGCFAVLTIFDIVADATDDDHYDDYGAGVLANWERENVDYEIESGEIEAVSAHWRNDVFRKTTIYPGEDFGGFLYLPLVPLADSLEVVAPIAGEEFSFRFRQVRR